MPARGARPGTTYAASARHPLTHSTMLIRRSRRVADRRNASRASASAVPSLRWASARASSGDKPRASSNAARSVKMRRELLVRVAAAVGPTAQAEGEETLDPVADWFEHRCPLPPRGQALRIARMAESVAAYSVTLADSLFSCARPWRSNGSSVRGGCSPWCPTRSRGARAPRGGGRPEAARCRRAPSGRRIGPRARR